MKKYVKPCMVCEEFAANEYVAACGDVGGSYRFVCDAGNKNSQYDLVTDAGENLSEDDWILNYFHPCDDTHTTSANGTDIFVSGRLYNTGGDDSKIGESTKGDKVIIWIERNRWGQMTNAHATTALQDFTHIVNRS